MNCVKCNISIPDARIKALPETKVCVDCSSEQAKGAVDIVYHKTGNTIQIMDKESADAINKAARRSGFGSLAALKGSSGGSTGKVKLGSFGEIPRMPTREDFERVGSKMIDMLDWKSRKEIINFLESKLDDRTISGFHFRKLKLILDEFKPEEKITYAHNDESSTSDEIDWVFKNWKNSKVYK